ncbi:hypothetical protein ScPMuIL_004116 [Solemya velum]
MEICDQCDCTLSEDTEEAKGVRSVNLRCHEGSLTWLNPYGAVRLRLSLGYPGDFEACFMIETANVMVKVSEEDSNSHRYVNTRSPYARYSNNDVMLKPLMTTSGKSKEYCLKSDTDIWLYLEPERTQTVQGLPIAVIYFDIERKYNVLMEDPLEECRPCDDKEILHSYCASDFVVVGSMTDVTHNLESGKSEINVAVSQIIRQRHGEQHFKRLKREASTLQGVITAPSKCGIVRGPGTFLFTGRFRFGKPKLGCAPYLQDWHKILKKAKHSGTIECSDD